MKFLACLVLVMVVCPSFGQQQEKPYNTLASLRSAFERTVTALSIAESEWQKMNKEIGQIRKQTDEREKLTKEREQILEQRIARSEERINSLKQDKAHLEKRLKDQEKSEELSKSLNASLKKTIRVGETKIRSQRIGLGILGTLLLGLVVYEIGDLAGAW